MKLTVIRVPDLPPVEKVVIELTPEDAYNVECGLRDALSKGTFSGGINIGQRIHDELAAIGLPRELSWRQRR